MCIAEAREQPNKVLAADVRAAMGPEAEARYTSVSLLQCLRQEGLFKCPSCSHVASLEVEEGAVVVACPACYCTVCPTCHRPSHAGSCRDAAVAANRPLIESLQAVGGRAILCPGCWMVLQKEGHECNHMTCQCGTHVCWVCAAELPRADTYRHFDECPQAGPLPANSRVLNRWQQANIVPQSKEEAAAAVLAAADLARRRPPPRRAATIAAFNCSQLLTGKRKLEPEPESGPALGGRARTRRQERSPELPHEQQQEPQQQQQPGLQVLPPQQQQQQPGLQPQLSAQQSGQPAELQAENDRLRQQLQQLQQEYNTLAAQLQKREQESITLRARLQQALAGQIVQHLEPQEQQQPAKPCLVGMPDNILARIAWYLDSGPRDRLNLAASCKRLLAAARQPSNSWLQRATLSAELFARLAQGTGPWFVEQVPALRQLTLVRDSSNSRALAAALGRPSSLTRLELLGISQLSNGLHHLSSLRQLSCLKIIKCCVTSLPAAFSSLTALTCLRCFAPLSYGVQQLASMSKLAELFLFSCNLLALPAAVSHLTSLTSLWINYNMQLSDGLQHLAGMGQLAKLSIRCCGFEGLPTELSSLTGLTSFDASSNMQLSGGLQHLSGMAQLAELDISMCSFTALPAELSSLTALTRLNTGGNRLCTGLSHLSSMQQLRHLSISNCASTALSTQGAEQPHGPHLSRCVETGSSADLEALAGMAHLACLDLSSCSLKTVPAALRQLTGLTTLSLSRNSELSCGLQNLEGMHCLARLNMGGCGFTTLPTTLAGLTALTYLDICHNHIQGGWQHAGKLMQLKHLYMEGCGLHAMPSQVTGLRDAGVKIML